MNRVLIIGGGAAGLTAAIAAAEGGASVTLYEKNDRVGKKILSTGNGKCNLTNADLSPDHYHSDSDPESFRRFTERLSNTEDLAFFQKIGIIPCRRGELYYPSGEQASSVLDALRLEVAALGVQVQTQTDLISEKGCKTLLRSLKEDPSLRIIVATGGAAAPKTGSDGKGIRFLSDLLSDQGGIKENPFVPALVPLTTEAKPFLKAWSGVRVNGKIMVSSNSDRLVSSEGQLQLTDYGISGIPAFQVSRFVSRRFMNTPKAKLSAVLDFCPEYSLSDLSGLIFHMGGHSGLLLGLLPKKLGEVILKECGLSSSLLAGVVSLREAERVARKIKNFELALTGTKGFDAAQVSAGGVCLEELNPEDWSLYKNPRIYCIGELADLDGDCGGYNLHHAWISGLAAGRSASE